MFAGMGCFWGAERKFWQAAACTRTGRSATHGGLSRRRPTYEEVCSGRTGHNEVVRVVYDPKARLATSGCWPSSGRHHDPTQGCGKANGRRQRSSVRRFTRTRRSSARPPDEVAPALPGRRLGERGRARITPEIADQPPALLFRGRTHHQQYLHKESRAGTAVLGGSVACPVRPASLLMRRDRRPIDGRWSRRELAGARGAGTPCGTSGRDAGRRACRRAATSSTFLMARGQVSVCSGPAFSPS
jgi:peptide-methionine (S)-S-oxide reductase